VLAFFNKNRYQVYKKIMELFAIYSLLVMLKASIPVASIHVLLDSCGIQEKVYEGAKV